MNIELLKEGFLLMIIGMGFVFFFLSIMIYVMNISGKVINFISKYFPEEIEEDKYLPKKKTTGNNDMEIALAIACVAARK